MDFDPKIRLRPWQTALLGVVLATGLVFVFAPEVSLLGTSAEPPSGPPTPTTVVPSEPLDHDRPGAAGDRAPASPRSGAASELPTTGRTYGPPISPLLPDLLARTGAQTTCVPQSSDVNLTVLSFNTHSARGSGRPGHGRRSRRDQGAGTPTSSCSRRSTATAPTPTTPTSRATTPSELGMDVAFGVNVRQGPRRVRRGDPVEVPDRRASRTRTSRTTRAARETSSAASCTRRSRSADTVISVYNTHLQHIFDSLRMRQMQTVTGSCAPTRCRRSWAAT